MFHSSDIEYMIKIREEIEKAMYVAFGVPKHLLGNIAHTPTQQVWCYPDGTKSLLKPKDGEKFFTYDHTMCVVDEIYEWDDSTHTWVSITGPTNISGIATKIGNVTAVGNNPTGSAILSPSGWLDGNTLEPIVGLDFAIQCECGSDKVGSSNHSSYCPKKGFDL